MKKSCRFLAIVLAVTICLAISSSVSAAAPSGVNTEYYGLLSGRTTRSGDIVSSTTTIGMNPDNAYLRVKMRLQEGTTNITPEVSGSSSRGVRSYTYRYDLSPYHDSNPNGGYATHEVRGGNTYDAEAYYTRFSLPA